jgi:glycosyltransferase involved in cell wall biosynthesis
VIATRFPHAVELLSEGAGITVPHGDPASMTSELRRLLTDRRLTSRMRMDARRLADGWFWPTIGRRFGSMMSDMADARRSAHRRAGQEVARVAG